MEARRAPVLGAFFTVNRSFFMSLFFLISGYLMVPSRRPPHGDARVVPRVGRPGLRLTHYRGAEYHGLMGNISDTG